MQKFKYKWIVGLVLLSMLLASVPGMLPGSVFAADLPAQLPDGAYYLDVELWEESGDQKADLDLLFQNNRQALAVIQDGVLSTLTLAFNPVSMDAAWLSGTEGIAAERAVQQFTVEGSPAKDPVRFSFLTSPENKIESGLLQAAYELKDTGFQVSSEADLWLSVQLQLTGEAFARRAYLRLSGTDPVKAKAGSLVPDSHMASDEPVPYLSAASTICLLQPKDTAAVDARVALPQAENDPADAPAQAALAEQAGSAEPAADGADAAETADADVSADAKAELQEIFPEEYMIRYRSADSSIARVTNTGLVTALAEGSTCITVTAEADGAPVLERSILVEVAKEAAAPASDQEAAGTVKLQEEVPQDSVALFDLDDEDYDDDDEDYDDDDDLLELDEADDDEDLDDDYYYNDLLDIGDEIAEYEDDKTGILIQYAEGSIDPEPEDMDIAVKEFKSGTVYDKAAASAQVQGKKFLVFNIRLADGNKDVTPTSDALIYIPIPEGWDGARMIAYKINANGSLTALDGDLDDDYLAFLTSGWGDFVIVEDNVVHNAVPYDDEDDDENETILATVSPTTGSNTAAKATTPNARTGDDANLMLWIVLAAAAAVVIIVTLIFHRKRQRS